MKKKIIGVYRPSNPLATIYPERIEAAIKKAEKENVLLVFFDDESVSFENQTIDGIYLDGESKMGIRTVIPKVIINPFPNSENEQTNTEKFLRQQSIFTSYSVLNKYDVYKKLLESEELSQYAIESIKVKNYLDIYKMLKKSDKVIFKPIMGRQGDHIYFISLKRDKIFIKENQEAIELSEETFKMFIDEKLSEGNYIVQPYIDAKTKKNEPYDFRVHLHRDHKGEWAIVKSYPRIGNKETILSNISKGGETKDINDFLKYEFGSKGSKIKKEIESLSIELANYINSFYSYKINEIGVDIAIDNEGNYWTYELNGDPQSKHHEEERAKYVIDYALYLHRKAVKDQLENDLKMNANEFIQVENKLLNKDFKDEIYIGILTHPNLDENFNLACGHVGLEKEIKVFYFYESDVNYKNKSINGKYYNRSNLERDVFAYPDVILDRLRMRGVEGYEKLYNEFEGFPFNNERNGLSVDKVFGYHLLENNETFKKNIIPYIETKDPKDTFDFIEKYKSIIVKPNQGSLGMGIIRINQLDTHYEYIKDHSIERIDASTLKKRLEELYENKHINQKNIKSIYKDNRPFDTRIHMAKNGEGKWSLVKSYVKVGAKNKVTSNSTSGGYLGKVEPVYSYKFGDLWKEKHNELIDTAYEWNKEIEKNIDKNISEIAYDVAITDEGEFYLYEINLNRPFSEFFNWELAYHLIPYCIYLVKENRKNKTIEASH